jgi:RND family efflux transporter MFP subunit
MVFCSKETRVSKFLILTGFALALLEVGCRKDSADTSEPVRPVRAVRIGDRVALKGRIFPGRAEPTQSVNIGFEVPGTVIEKPIAKGDRVKEGDLLARLDARDYQNDLDATKSERDRAKAHLERIEKAVKSGAVSKQDLSDAQAAYDIADAQVKIKAKAVEDTQIRAPYDGVIADTYVKTFQRVQAKEDVVRVLDTSRIEITINLPENLISFAPHVKEIYCRFDAFPDHEIPATIIEIGTEASATTRTYPVTLIMDQPKDITILSGMTGSVFGKGDLPENFATGGVDIPLTALFTDSSNQSCVWVIDDSTDTVKRRVVEKVELTNQGIRVTGLSAGDWVATAGASYLQEGQKVRILEETPVEVSL